MIGMNEYGKSVCACTFSKLDEAFHEYTQCMSNDEQVIFYIFATSGDLEKVEEETMKTHLENYEKTMKTHLGNFTTDSTFAPGIDGKDHGLNFLNHTFCTCLSNL